MAQAQELARLGLTELTAPSAFSTFSRYPVFRHSHGGGRDAGLIDGCNFERQDDNRLGKTLKSVWYC